MTRSIFAASAVVLALTLTAPGPAQAAPYWPWCSQYFEPSYAHACAFASWAQCMETVSGIGGYCYANPYPPSARTVVPRRHARG